MQSAMKMTHFKSKGRTINVIQVVTTEIVQLPAGPRGQAGPRHVDTHTQVLNLHLLPL